MGIKFEFFLKIGRNAPNLLKIVKESPYKYKGNIAILVLCNLYGGAGDQGLAMAFLLSQFHFYSNLSKFLKSSCKCVHTQNTSRISFLGQLHDHLLQ